MNLSNISSTKVAPEIHLSPELDPSVNKSGVSSRDGIDVDLPTNPGKVRQEGEKEISHPTKLAEKKPSLLVRLLSKIPDICANIVTLGLHSIMQSAQREPIPPYQFELPGTKGKSVEVDSNIGPKKIPKGMTHEQVQAALQEKVNAGHKLFSEVSLGNRTGGCTMEDMTNLMFYLQVKAEDKQGACFKEGAFNLPDPGQRLRKFLDSCPEAYQRDSSHISDFQHLPGGQHRGIDAYGSGKKMDELLPHGMKTLLFGSLPQNDGLRMPEDRIYLKIETHGAYLTRPRGGSDAEGPSRSMNRHDFGASFKHTFSFLATRGQGSAAGSFKERIPDTVKNEFKALEALLPEAEKAILNDGKPLSTAGGIRVMLANAESVLARDNELSGPAKEALTEFIDGIKAKYNDPHVRFGNEIIFSPEELAGTPPTPSDVPPSPLVGVPKVTMTPTPLTQEAQMLPTDTPPLEGVPKVTTTPTPLTQEAQMLPTDTPALEGVPKVTTTPTLVTQEPHVLPMTE